MKKQSSIEWFAEMVAQMRYVNIDILEQAKAMHKEDVKNAYNIGYRDGENDGVNFCGKEKDISEYNNAEQHYEETFNNDSTN